MSTGRSTQLQGTNACLLTTDLVRYQSFPPRTASFSGTHSWTRQAPDHLQCAGFYWATVCKTVRPMTSDRCLSCLSCL